jgi:hypothetical protein
VPVISGTLAHFAPARGFPPNQIIPALVVLVVLTAVVWVEAVRFRRGGAPRLRRLVRRTEERTGLPGWATVGIGLTSVSLIVAAFGFYWDVAWHIDKGRDQGPFATPAHFFIVFGLLGIALAGLASMVVGVERPTPTSVRLTRRWNAPVGGVLLAICGFVALGGFPLDDLWHTLFGQDVTLWSPTHIQMIGGASLATLATWILLEEGRRARATEARPGWFLRNADVLVGGSFLLGLSTLQAEFDYGVPQFRQLYHPVLVMLAAGIGLVAVRVRGRRGSAAGAAVFFLLFRAMLTLLVGPVLGRSTLHFPLYLPEALLVEAVAWRIPRERYLRIGLVSGALIGTVGLPAEWAWTHAFMVFPWTGALWPEGAVMGFVAAVAGAVLGAAIGRALVPERAALGASNRGPWRGVAVAAAGIVALVVVALPLHMTAHTSYRATVALTTASPGPDQTVNATVQLRPPDAAVGANWFDVTAWQGGTGSWGGGIEGFVLSPLRRVGPGMYRTTRPFPVYGNWKALIRLHTGNSIQAVPVYLPADPAIPAKGVPASPLFRRNFEPDKRILQREAVGGSRLIQNVAYVVLGLLALLWIASLGWGLRRLSVGARTSGQRGRSRSFPVVRRASRSSWARRASASG